MNANFENNTNHANNLFEAFAPKTLALPLPTMTEDALNPYLGTVLCPSRISAKLPEGKLVATVQKKVDLSLSLNTDGVATQYALWYIPHSDYQLQSLQIGRYNGGIWYWQTPAPNWSEDLSLNFYDQRLVSGEISTYSNTIGPGLLLLSGSANAVSFDDAPDWSTLNYESVIGYTRSLASIRKGVPASEGVIMQARPLSNTILRPFRASTAVNEATQVSDYYTTTGNRDLTYFPAIGVANSTFFNANIYDPSSLNHNSNGNALCKIQVDFQLATIPIAAPGTLPAVTVQLLGYTYNTGTATYAQTVLASQTFNPTINGVASGANFVYAFQGSCIFNPSTLPSTITITCNSSIRLDINTNNTVNVNYLGQDDDGVVFPGSAVIWRGLGSGQQLIVQGTHNYECTPKPEISKQIKASFNNEPFADYSAAVGVLSSLMRVGYDNIFSISEYKALMKDIDYIFIRRQNYKFGSASPFWSVAAEVAKPLAKSALKSLLGTACDKAKEFGYASSKSVVTSPIDTIIKMEEETIGAGLNPVKIEEEEVERPPEEVVLTKDNYSAELVRMILRMSEDLASRQLGDKHPALLMTYDDDQISAAETLGLQPAPWYGYCYLYPVVWSYTGRPWEDVVKMSTHDILKECRKIKSKLKTNIELHALERLMKAGRDKGDIADLIPLIQAGIKPLNTYVAEMEEGDPEPAFVVVYDKGLGHIYFNPDSSPFDTFYSYITDFPENKLGSNSFLQRLAQKKLEAIEKPKVLNAPVMVKPRSNLYGYADYLLGRDSRKGQKTQDIVLGKRPLVDGTGFQQFPYVMKSENTVKTGMLAFTEKPVDYYPKGSSKEGEAVTYYEPQTCVQLLNDDFEFSVIVSTSLGEEAAKSICTSLQWMRSSMKKQYVTLIATDMVEGPSLSAAALYYAVGGYNFLMTTGVVADRKSVV